MESLVMNDFFAVVSSTLSCETNVKNYQWIYCQRTNTEQNLPLWSYWLVMPRYSITLRRNECYILSFPICKVQIFWAGLKKLAHLPPFLWKNLVVSNYKWVKILWPSQNIWTFLTYKNSISNGRSVWVLRNYFSPIEHCVVDNI